MPPSLMCEFDLKWLFTRTVWKLTLAFGLLPNHFLHLFYFHFMQFLFPTHNAQCKWLDFK